MAESLQTWRTYQNAAWHVDNMSLVWTTSHSMSFFNPQNSFRVCVDVAGLQQLTSLLARLLNTQGARLQQQEKLVLRARSQRGNHPVSTRDGTFYLVADIVGAVRVSSASTSLPQLRHVSLVSTRTSLWHISRLPHGGREKGVKCRCIFFSPRKPTGLFFKWKAGWRRSVAL